MIRVGVLGAAGRMGATVCGAVANDARFELVAVVDPHASGQSLKAIVPDLETNLVIGSDVDALGEANVDAVVDFTVAASAVSNLEWCANNGVHAVCGTTGIDDIELGHLATLFDDPQAPNCVFASNFAVSAVLMMRFSELAAKFFDNIEIIELHHNQKRDAPSGTALETAKRMVAAREGKSFLADPTTDEKRAGARGGNEDGVRIHSVRLPGLLAHQEVLFGAVGQALQIRQDSFDRSSFMPGVVLALSKVQNTPGFTVGLESLLDV